MYEESAGIPMLVAGEGVPAGGAVPDAGDIVRRVRDDARRRRRVGRHRRAGLARGFVAGTRRPPPQDRTVLSQFHTYGPDAFYMLRDQRHKYVHYVGAPPQLFDLEADPEELTDLGTDTAHEPQRAAFEARLRAILDPEVGGPAGQSRPGSDGGASRRLCDVAPAGKNGLYAAPSRRDPLTAWVIRQCAELSQDCGPSCDA